MKQEPVAWWNKKYEILHPDAIDVVKSDEWDIPLYTEPQYRELSDEEIYELYAGPVTSDREMVEFAHAILKKASEK